MKDDPENVGRWAVVIIVILFLLPWVIYKVNKERRHMDVEPGVSQTIPTLPTHTSEEAFILPGEVEEYETNRERVGTDSGNVVLLRAGSIRVDANGNKTTHWVPISSDIRHMRNSRGEQWTPADKDDCWTRDSPYVRWDVGLDKVTDLLQAKVPAGCPPSSFTLRYKER